MGLHMWKNNNLSQYCRIQIKFLYTEIGFHRTAIILTIITLLLTIVFYENHKVKNQLLLENSIRNESSLMTLIAQNSPQEFAIYIDQVKQNRLANHNSDNEAILANDLIRNQFHKFLPAASNDSIFNYLMTILNIYKKLYVEHPNSVLYLEFSDKFKDELANDKSINDISGSASLTKAIQEVIETGIKNKNPTVLTNTDEVNASTMTNTILSELATQFGNGVVSNTLNNPTDPELDKKISAEIIITFYEKVLDQGKENAGLIMKYIFR